MSAPAAAVPNAVSSGTGDTGQHPILSDPPTAAPPQSESKAPPEVELLHLFQAAYGSPVQSDQATEPNEGTAAAVVADSRAPGSGPYKIGTEAPPRKDADERLQASRTVMEDTLLDKLLSMYGQQSIFRSPVFIELFKFIWNFRIINYQQYLGLNVGQLTVSSHIQNSNAEKSDLDAPAIRTLGQHAQLPRSQAGLQHEVLAAHFLRSIRFIRLLSRDHDCCMLLSDTKSPLAGSFPNEPLPNVAAAEVTLPVHVLHAICVTILDWVDQISRDSAASYSPPLVESASPPRAVVSRKLFEYLCEIMSEVLSLVRRMCSLAMKRPQVQSEASSASVDALSLRHEVVSIASIASSGIVTQALRALVLFESTKPSTKIAAGVDLSTYRRSRDVIIRASISILSQIVSADTCTLNNPKASELLLASMTTPGNPFITSSRPDVAATLAPAWYNWHTALGSLTTKNGSGDAPSETESNAKSSQLLLKPQSCYAASSIPFTSLILAASQLNSFVRAILLLAEIGLGLVAVSESSESRTNEPPQQSSCYDAYLWRQKFPPFANQSVSDSPQDDHAHIRHLQFKPMIQLQALAILETIVLHARTLHRLYPTQSQYEVWGAKRVSDDIRRGSPAPQPESSDCVSLPKCAVLLRGSAYLQRSDATEARYKCSLSTAEAWGLTPDGALASDTVRTDGMDVAYVTQPPESEPNASCTTISVSLGHAARDLLASIHSAGVQFFLWYAAQGMKQSVSAQVHVKHAASEARFQTIIRLLNLTRTPCCWTSVLMSMSDKVLDKRFQPGALWHNLSSMEDKLHPIDSLGLVASTAFWNSACLDQVSPGGLSIVKTPQLRSESWIAFFGAMLLDMFKIFSAKPTLSQVLNSRTSSHASNPLFQTLIQLLAPCIVSRQKQMQVRSDCVIRLDVASPNLPSSVAGETLVAAPVTVTARTYPLDSAQESAGTSKQNPQQQDGLAFSIPLGYVDALQRITLACSSLLQVVLTDGNASLTCVAHGLTKTLSGLLLSIAVPELEFVASLLPSSTTNAIAPSLEESAAQASAWIEQINSDLASETLPCGTWKHFLSENTVQPSPIEVSPEESAGSQEVSGSQDAITTDTLASLRLDVRKASISSSPLVAVEHVQSIPVMVRWRGLSSQMRSLTRLTQCHILRLLKLLLIPYPTRQLLKERPDLAPPPGLALSILKGGVAAPPEARASFDTKGQRTPTAASSPVLSPLPLASPSEAPMETQVSKLSHSLNLVTVAQLLAALRINDGFRSSSSHNSIQEVYNEHLESRSLKPCKQFFVATRASSRSSDMVPYAETRRAATLLSLTAAACVNQHIFGPGLALCDISRATEPLPIIISPATKYLSETLIQTPQLSNSVRSDIVREGKANATIRFAEPSDFALSCLQSHALGLPSIIFPRGALPGNVREDDRAALQSSTVRSIQAELSTLVFPQLLRIASWKVLEVTQESFLSRKQNNLNQSDSSRRQQQSSVSLNQDTNVTKPAIGLVRQYVLLRRLGAGASGEVFLAWDAKPDAKRRRNIILNWLRSQTHDGGRHEERTNKVMGLLEQRLASLGLEKEPEQNLVEEQMRYSAADDLSDRVRRPSTQTRSSHTYTDSDVSSDQGFEPTSGRSDEEGDEGPTQVYTARRRSRSRSGTSSSFGHGFSRAHHGRVGSAPTDSKPSTGSASNADDTTSVSSLLPVERESTQGTRRRSTSRYRSKREDIECSEGLQRAVRPLFAIKRIPLQQSLRGSKTDHQATYAAERVCQEVAHLAAMGHTNLVRFVEAFVEDTFLFIVTDYAEGPSLLAESSSLLLWHLRLNERTLWSAFGQLLRACEHLHNLETLALRHDEKITSSERSESRSTDSGPTSTGETSRSSVGLVHRDLSPGNVLLASNSSPQVFAQDRSFRERRAQIALSLTRPKSTMHEPYPIPIGTEFRITNCSCLSCALLDFGPGLSVFEGDVASEHYLLTQPSGNHSGSGPYPGAREGNRLKSPLPPPSIFVTGSSSIDTALTPAHGTPARGSQAFGVAVGVNVPTVSPDYLVRATSLTARSTASLPRANPQFSTSLPLSPGDRTASDRMSSRSLSSLPESQEFPFSTSQTTMDFRPDSPHSTVYSVAAGSVIASSYRPAFTHESDTMSQSRHQDNDQIDLSVSGSGITLYCRNILIHKGKTDFSYISRPTIKKLFGAPAVLPLGALDEEYAYSIQDDGRGAMLLKVADLGLAANVNAMSPESTTDAKSSRPVAVGTAGFIAPEILKGSLPSTSSDIWAVGALMYLLMEGKPPFSTDANPTYAFAAFMQAGKLAIEGAKPHFSTTANALYSSRLRNLVERCLSAEPSDRPTASAALSQVHLGLRALEASRRIRSAALHSMESTTDRHPDSRPSLAAEVSPAPSITPHSDKVRKPTQRFSSPQQRHPTSSPSSNASFARNLFPTFNDSSSLAEHTQGQTLTSSIPMAKSVKRVLTSEVSEHPLSASRDLASGDTGHTGTTAATAAAISAPFSGGNTNSNVTSSAVSRLTRATRTSRQHSPLPGLSLLSRVLNPQPALGNPHTLESPSPSPTPSPTSFGLAVETSEANSSTDYQRHGSRFSSSNVPLVLPALVPTTPTDRLLQSSLGGQPKKGILRNQ